MKIEISKETIEKLVWNLKKSDCVATEFLVKIPLPQKYELLAMVMVIKDGIDDFSDAMDLARAKVKPDELDKHLMEIQFLEECHLQDVLSFGLSHFENLVGYN
jgi:hypothetical protein